MTAATGTLIDKNAGGANAIQAGVDYYKPAYGVDNQTCSKMSADGPLIGVITGIDPKTCDEIAAKGYERFTLA